MVGFVLPAFSQNLSNNGIENICLFGGKCGCNEINALLWMKKHVETWERKFVINGVTLKAKSRLGFMSARAKRGTRQPRAF